MANQETQKIPSGKWFKATYGSHRFTQEEANALCRGEEIRIENFVTKAGKVITITGRLGERKHGDKTYFGFIRTDLRAKDDYSYYNRFSYPEIPEDMREPQPWPEHWVPDACAYRD